MSDKLKKHVSNMSSRPIPEHTYLPIYQLKHSNL